MTITEKNILKHEIEDAICHDFWTDFDEMLDGLNELLADNGVPAGTVYGNEEYIVVEGTEEDVVYLAYVGHANRTRWIEKVVLG